ADEFVEVPKLEPNELEQELKAVEEQFESLEGPPEIKEKARLPLWEKLARLNTALGRGDDAGLCWMNVLWARDPPPDAAWGWFRAEARVPEAPGSDKRRPWAAAAAQARGPAREVSAEDLDYVLGLEDPSGADVRTLAAYVYWAAQQKRPPSSLVRRLGAVRQLLERHERFLPVRAAWLAWCGVVRLSSGGVLALGRARDRRLERLYQQGLRPEQDMPTFLRYPGQPSSERFRAFRHWFGRLRELAQEWSRTVGRSDISAPPEARTADYIDLIFAFGFARLGEADAANQLLTEVHEGVTQTTQNSGKRVGAALDRESLEARLHEELLKAYRYRIVQAVQGRPPSGPLPQEVLDGLTEVKTLEEALKKRFKDSSDKEVSS